MTRSEAATDGRRGAFEGAVRDPFGRRNRFRRQPRYPESRAGGFASLPRDSFADDNLHRARRLARDVAYIMLNGPDGCQARPEERSLPGIGCCFFSRVASR
jgi:hypothetical protein